jgi:hypothetical protein
MRRSRYESPVEEVEVIRSPTRLSSRMTPSAPRTQVVTRQVRSRSPSRIYDEEDVEMPPEEILTGELETNEPVIYSRSPTRVASRNSPVSSRSPTRVASRNSPVRSSSYRSPVRMSPSRVDSIPTDARILYDDVGNRTGYIYNNEFFRL